MLMDDARATEVLRIAQLGRDGLQVYPLGWDESWCVTIHVERFEDNTEFAIWTTNPEIDPYAHRTIGERPSLSDCIPPLMRKLAGMPGVGVDFVISSADLELVANIAAAIQPETYLEAIAVDFRHVDADGLA